MRLAVVALSIVALVCAFAGPAAADRPAAFTFVDVFSDVNPCTGNAMTVTITFNGVLHEHGSREVVHVKRTITTSDGFAGRGTESFVYNGQVRRARLTDIMTNAFGDRFRAHAVFVEDVSSGTVRVERFSLTCLGR